MPERVILSVGTRKGLFVAEAARDRGGFDLRGPFGAGAPVDATLIDRRGTPRNYASSCNMFYGGGSWGRTDRGLPERESYFTVLRDAMDFDRLASPALYFGTTTGQLWMGRDGGEDWNCLFHSLPPIHCLKAAVV